MNHRAAWTARGSINKFLRVNRKKIDTQKVRCGCVCLASGCSCTPPLPAGVLGCVCVCVHTPLVSRHSWLGCVVWLCVLGLRFRLRPTTPGWGVGVDVCLYARFASALPLLAGVSGMGVCLGAGCGCTPPLLAGVLGCVCVCVRAPLVPRHSWLGCAVWLCVLGLRFRLRTALLAGVLGCVCVCVRDPLLPLGWRTQNDINQGNGVRN